MKHLASCASYSLAELFPGEPRPVELSECAWEEVRITDCATGCPILEQDLEAALRRGVELADRFGW